MRCIAEELEKGSGHRGLEYYVVTTLVAPGRSIVVVEGSVRVSKRRFPVASES